MNYLDQLNGHQDLERLAHEQNRMFVVSPYCRIKNSNKKRFDKPIEHLIR